MRWLEQFAPTVVVTQDCLGGNGELSPDIAPTITARALDGNHRLTALKREMDHESEIGMRVYLEFNEAEERLIANGEPPAV